MDTLLRDLAPAEPGLIRNVPYDDLVVGQTATVTRTVTSADLALVAAVLGDGRAGSPGYGLFGASLVAAAIANALPGPGTVCVHNALTFSGAIAAGETVRVTVGVVEKRAGNRVLLECAVATAAGATVVSGPVEVIAPTEAISRPLATPEFQLLNHAGHDALLAKCHGLEPVTTAVAYPCDEVSLRGAVEAARAGLIEPILVGPEEKIRAIAARFGLDIGAFRLVPAENEQDAAARAVAQVRDGAAKALMKGCLHSDTLLAEVVRRDTGLRAGRKISHVFVMHPPGRETPLLVTDAAVMMYPTLEEKVDITQNAIDLAHALGMAEPRVAVLSAVETVNPKIPSTLDAAALSTMAARGQIRGAIVDGPLAFDNAVDPEAARIKGIRSEVAGRADILVVPNFEAGNMVAKELSKLAHADAAGIVLGARCPIILTSRSDDERSRVASCAVALLVARANAKA